MADKPRFIDVEFLLQHTAAARKFVEECEGHAFQEWMDHRVFRECDPYWNLPFESPLEAAFWVWWQALVGTTGHIARHLELRPQVEVLTGGDLFRLDFSVELIQHYRQTVGALGLSWKPIAVELDGHAFHEKTREQVTYRNRRDRLLQQDGWRVFHISFDEMQQRGGNAVAEVTHYAIEQFTTLQSQAHRFKQQTQSVGLEVERAK